MSLFFRRSLTLLFPPGGRLSISARRWPCAAFHSHHHPRNQDSSDSTTSTVGSGVNKGGVGSSILPPGSTQTEQEKLIFMYTCGVCETKSARTITKHGYLHGVVLVRCPTCLSLHLIADHKGMFGPKGNVHDFVKERYGAPTTPLGPVKLEFDDNGMLVGFQKRDHSASDDDHVLEL